MVVRECGTKELGFARESVESASDIAGCMKTAASTMTANFFMWILPLLDALPTLDHIRATAIRPCGPRSSFYLWEPVTVTVLTLMPPISRFAVFSQPVLRFKPLLPSHRWMTREHIERCKHKRRPGIGDRAVGKDLVRRLARRPCANRTGGTCPAAHIEKL